MKPQIEIMTSQKISELLERLKSRLTFDESRESQIREDYRAALYRAEQEPSNGAAALKAKLRATLDEITATNAETRLSITAAEAHHAEALEREHEERDSGRWKKAEQIAKRRLALANEIAAETSALAEKYKTLVQLGTALLLELPKKESGLSFMPAQTENDFRLQMRKSGFIWAVAGWSFSEESLPGLVDRVADSNAWAFKFRPPQPETEKATAKKTG